MLTLIYRFFEVPRWCKRGITLLCDATFVIAALVGALLIRVGDEWERWFDANLWYLLITLSITSIAVWIRLGLYRAVIRYIDVKVLASILWGSVASSIALLFLLFIFNIELPRSVPFIYTALIVISVAGSRLLVRGLINARNNKNKEPVIIYGAGASGRQLCVSLQNGNEYEPVAFVDDEQSLQNTSVAGVEVFSSEKLELLVDGMKINKVLFAIPSISKDQKRNIFNSVQKMKVEMLTIPGTADLVSGKVCVSQLKSVQIEDLLGRDEVKPFLDLINKCIYGQVVLVTGAGGSIGSELCRKIIVEKPAKLILLELSEFNLYAIENGLKKASRDIPIYPILGSVTDTELVKRVFNNYRIDTVYHAAAYKHVPLVEFNTFSGVYNNVWGTKVVAEQALKSSVSYFVLISTDKAVRPTNVMGTSKRLAELVIQDVASRAKKTVFSMVRFGNVLGSSGSVIPYFKKQIEDGGPVTVTHPEITRYFMTIPEAASLVIQAGAMAKGGDVFVLDMGKPVKIANLAKKMIQLMGYSVKDDNNNSGDIEIVYSGLRPGEKLYEELLIDGDVLDTKHPRIMKANEISMEAKDLSNLLSDLHQCIQENDVVRLRELLISAPTGFNPSTPVCDLLSIATHETNSRGEKPSASIHVISR